jgi:hypothetical protein
MDKIIVISYETNMTHANAQLFKKTLDNNHWEYAFIGNGTKWNGVQDKIIGYFHHLQILDAQQVVLLSDARDVFCLRSSAQLLEKVKDIVETKIILSAEMFLQKHMNWSEPEEQQNSDFWQGKPLHAYWQFHHMENLPIRKYINTGLILGKVCHLLHAFEWIIQHNYTDDQLGFCEYTNQFPQNIYLDFDANWLHTSGCFVNGSFYNHSIQKQIARHFLN